MVLFALYCPYSAHFILDFVLIFSEIIVLTYICIFIKYCHPLTAQGIWVFFLSFSVIKDDTFILQRSVSDATVVALKNTQRALLRYKTVNQEPVFIKENYINMLVDR